MSEYITTSEVIELAKEAGYLKKKATWKDARKVLSVWHKKFELGKHSATGRLLFDKAKIIRFLEIE